jgi:hypothetical protein
LGIPSIARSATFNTEASLGSEEGAKADFVAKADNNADNLFIEDVRVSISAPRTPFERERFF